VTTICAVVVTYNRKALLRECLQALLAQTRPVSKILVIDNLSSDGTPEMVLAQFPSERFAQIELITLASNVGGAGGFHEGLKQAAAAGYEWLWLMDDDTIPQPDALEQLFTARDRFPTESRPDLLASRVVWTDGTLHSMNMPFQRQDDPPYAVLAAACGTLSLRAATFVSLLLHRRYVERFGLPYADYFIWGDDTEYTARILREERGILAPQSVVVHRTPTNHTAMTAEPPKFYYFVRNELWMTFHSRALTSKERLKRVLATARHTLLYLSRRSFEGQAIKHVALALWHATTKRPAR
jgi:rhamnopyranosyl-N-acetylglucosaminyl-diphospho-decaprenol beta-1,3/1,4-galactofuranosyltransferase